MLHCFDRILVQGILPPLSYGRGTTAYFYEHKLRTFGFTEWAKPLREAIRENAARLAAEAGVEIEVVRKRSVRREDRVQEILQRRGSPGLVCILAAMERCRTFHPWYDRDSTAASISSRRTIRGCWRSRPMVNSASAASATQACAASCQTSRSGQTSRMPQRLRHHGILRTVPKTYKYYLTEFRKDLFLVPQLASEVA